MKDGLQRLVCIPARSMVHLLRFYQRWVSPCLGNVCRFHPSCSEYAIESFENFGFCKGFLLTLKRLLKCHPFHPGGVDYPPKP